MDPLSLAATIVGSFLVPFFREGARRLGEALSDESDSSTADQLVETSEKIWGRLVTLFDEPDERKALELFERFPDDLERRVETMLRERLQADERLLAELYGLVSEPTPGAASTGVQVMRAHNVGIIDNRNADISGDATFIAQNFEGEPPDRPSGPSR
jgi:hypothetical protein